MISPRPPFTFLTVFFLSFSFLPFTLVLVAFVLLVIVRLGLDRPSWLQFPIHVVSEWLNAPLLSFQTAAARDVAGAAL